MKKSLIVLAMLPLAACWSGNDGKASGNNEEVKARKELAGKELVATMRKISGRWKSEPGVFPEEKDNWVSLDIANSKDYTLELRGTTGTMDAIYVSSAGKITVYDDKTADGKEAKGARGPLRNYSAFSIKFTSPGQMELTPKAGKGPVVKLIYKGL